MYNKDIKIGRLTDNPDMRYTNDGTAVTNFSIAVDRSYGDKTDFFDVVAWNMGNYKLAEYTAEYSKGDLVFIEGELQQQRWKKDGQSRSKVVIKANTIRNFSKKKESKGLEDFDADEFDMPFDD